MTIRVGANSGAALGKVMVRTPFSMAALTSSSLDLLSAFYLELTQGCMETYLDTLRKLESPRELSETAFSDGVSTLVVLGRRLCLRRNSELVVLDIDLDIFFRDSGEFEGGCYEVLLGVLVEVHSEMRNRQCYVQ